MSKFALLFLTVFLGCILAAFALSPVAAFVLYQLVYLLNPDARWWSASIPGLRYSMITVLLMMTVLLLRYKELSAKSPWSRQPMFKWLLAILAMYYFMYLHAVNLPVHKQFTFDFLKLVIIVMVAYKLIHSERALNAVLWAYLIGVTYIGYLATITGRSAGGRVDGIGLVDGTDANDTSAVMVPAAVLLMYLAWMGNWKVKLLCAFCGAFIANGLVLLNSRGAFLGAGIGVIFFTLVMLFSRFQRKGQRAMAIFIVALGLGGGLYVTDQAFWERMGTLQADEEGRRGGDGRMEFWFTTFDVLRDYPMGVGIWGFQTVSAGYLSEEQLARGVGERAVHSTWFQNLAELGWAGPLLFAGLLGSVLLQNRRVKRYLIEQGRTDEYFKILALEGSLLSYMVTISFIDRFRAEIFYWLFLFLAAAANVYYLQYQESGAAKRHRTFNRQLGREPEAT